MKSPFSTPFVSLLFTSELFFTRLLFAVAIYWVTIDNIVQVTAEVTQTAINPWDSQKIKHVRKWQYETSSGQLA